LASPPGLRRPRRMLQHLHERSRTRRDAASLVVEDVEVPAYADAAKPDLTQTPGLDLGADRVGRDERNAEARHDALLDRLGVIQLHRDPEFHSRPLESPLGDTPTGGS